MKKLIFLSLMILIIALVIIFIREKTHNDNHSQRAIEEEAGFELSGYYYFGYLDEREKLDQASEKEYFNMMDTQFQAYYQSMFQLFEEDAKLSEDIIAYFESIGGLRLYSMPATDTTLQNGDYLTLLVKGPIQESYPAVITKIENIELRYPRN
ncbi:hypothetical protein [Amphibacillus indicireducens]|uniref:Uncharacterized protein n=1 Tax=Amphibacillus indicireducens TaxID=1076330 RepID=A0ABP7V4K5_9BACI